METSVQFTDGKIVLTGNVPSRGAPKKADYVLYRNPYKPIAVVEAKDNHHTVSFGLQQAMQYAQMLDVPFAFSSNGDAFFEHDFLTGQEREIPLDQFPTLDELLARIDAAQAPSDRERQIIDLLSGHHESRSLQGYKNAFCFGNYLELHSGHPGCPR